MISVVEQPAVTSPGTLEQVVVSMVVTEAGTVVILSDVEVDTLFVVIVANFVAVGVD